MKKSKNWSLFWTIIIGLLFVTICFIVSVHFNVHGHFFNDKFGDSEYLYYYLSLVFAFSLIVIAWVKLNDVNREMRASFLLDIDKRWGNTESLKAREVIHKLYLECEDDGKPANESRPLIFERVARKIVELRNDKNKVADFVSILNFIDFMETIGYLFKNGYVDKKDLDELCGHSLRFNYQIFRLYIKDKRERNHQEDFYKYFADLYNDLNEEFNNGGK